VFPNTYTKYLVEISFRSDYLVIDDYLEVEPGTITLSAIENTNYYIRAYGIAGTDKTNSVSVTVTTSNLPAYPSVSLSTPSITSIDILNPNEGLVTFTEVSNASNYILEISEVNTFNILVNYVNQFRLATNKVLVSGLSPTKTYYARLYAFNENTVSNYSLTSTIDNSP
jgi:hypothetical protein